MGLALMRGNYKDKRAFLDTWIVPSQILTSTADHVDWIPLISRLCIAKRTLIMLFANPSGPSHGGSGAVGGACWHGLDGTQPCKGKQPCN